MSESRAHAPLPWSLWGRVSRPAKPLWALLAVSLIVAGETFLDFSPTYPLYMSVLVIGVAAWLSIRAWRRRAFVGLLALPLSVPWMGHLWGADWLSEQQAVFYTAHSLFSVFVAIAAYTFMAREVSA